MRKKKCYINSNLSLIATNKLIDKKLYFFRTKNSCTCAFFHEITCAILVVNVVQEITSIS